MQALRRYWYALLLPVGVLIGVGAAQFRDSPTTASLPATSTTTSPTLDIAVDDPSDVFDAGAFVDIPPGGTLLLTNEDDIDRRLRLVVGDLRLQVAVDGVDGVLDAASVGVVSVPGSATVEIVNPHGVPASIEFETEPGAAFGVDTRTA